ALRGRPNVEINTGVATEGHPYNYFSEITTCWIVGGSGWIVLLENPALANICSNSENVYASPDGVPASIIKLNCAESGGVTRSSFGTNSNVTARPLSASAARTFRNNVSHVGASK